jgi:dUTP pyrophosphatase
VTAYQQTAFSSAVDGVPVLIKRLDQGLPLPARAHPGDAGVDLCTAVDVVLAPGERALVPTGMAIALPEGYAAFVHPRSGLAARHGVTIVNAPGTVDAGYRGEIKVTLLNTDRAEPVRFERGDRIAQLVVQQVACPQFHEVQTLPGSARGDGGFGSTGGHGPVAEDPRQQGPGPVTEEPGRRPSGGSRGVVPPGQQGHGGDESTARQ